MWRFAVLCLALSSANSRILDEKSFVSRDPLDEWRHLEANEIPTNVDDYYDMIPAEVLLQPIKPSVRLPEVEQRPSDTTVATNDASAVPEHSTLAQMIEEYQNNTLPEYTEDADGYLVFPGIGRFKLHHEDYVWSSARDQCIREGGDLAVPDSEQKVAVFMKMFEMHPEIPARAILRQQVYIGIQDPEDTREFVTVTGEPVSLDLPLWAEGEPDNQHPGQEDCVTFRTDARIRDVPCHFFLPFFCEKSL